MKKKITQHKFFGSSIKKKGWNPILSIDGQWQCSRQNCIKDAKHYRHTFVNDKMLTEFACTRHATAPKKKGVIAWQLNLYR